MEGKDDQYMKRALELAKKGAGKVNPNPLVGSVLVKNNRIIGEGYHEFFGGPHAEINALDAAKESIEGATLYVTLEPCSHHGKTPPCTEAIIKNKIEKVVVAMIDPNPVVSGNGVKNLRDNGIAVEVGAFESQAARLNEIYLKYVSTALPFVTIKTAMTLDGKIASVTGDSKWISNEKSREYVHHLRDKYSGIMVGINTILNDNPFLSTRLKDHDGKDPCRIIVDSHAKIPLDANVLTLDSRAHTIVATTDLADNTKLDVIRKLAHEVIITPARNERVDLKYLMEKLGEKGLDSILIEGGGTLNFSALAEGIVDKVISFVSPKIIGGYNAKTPVSGEGICKIGDAFRLKNISVNRFDEDILIEGYIN